MPYATYAHLSLAAITGPRHSSQSLVPGTRHSLWSQAPFTISGPRHPSLALSYEESVDDGSECVAAVVDAISHTQTTANITRVVGEKPEAEAAGKAYMYFLQRVFGGHSASEEIYVHPKASSTAGPKVRPHHLLSVHKVASDRKRVG
nr:uncharacterized protein LOC128696017 [Cherax quadricarinatus]